MTDNGSRPTEIPWALDELVDSVGGIGAIALSTDGMLIQKSTHFTKDKADSLAAIASTLSSVARGIQQQFDGGRVRQTVVEQAEQFVIVTAAGANACLALMTPIDADLGVATYEMNRLVQTLGRHLATQQRDTGSPVTEFRGR